MSNPRDANLFRKYSKAVAVLLLVVSLVSVLAACGKKEDEYMPLYETQEFDPDESPGATPYESTPVPADIVSAALPELNEEQIQQLQDQLEEVHAALLKANADYIAEMDAREADRIAFEETQGKITEWESEIKRLMEELDAKDAALKNKTPPELDIKMVHGLYEGKGELSTLTYNYEITVEVKPSSNFLTEKTLVYIISGSMKIGVNFDEVRKSISINDNTKTVTITIPKAYVISNETGDGIPERFDVNKGVFSTFNKAEDVDYKSAQDAAKVKAVEQVTARNSNGESMLTYAQRLAGMEFVGLLEPITSKSGYQVVVKYE